MSLLIELNLSLLFFSYGCHRQSMNDSDDMDMHILYISHLPSLVYNIFVCKANFSGASEI